GKPVVVVLKNGRALALSGAVRNAQAILVTWFLGSETGRGIADILFGDFGPSGRLPVSFPRRSGQQPFYYDRKNTGRPADPNLEEEEYKARYRETPNTALYPFGHGLTYGRIEYGAVELSAPELPLNGTLEVAVTVTNRGARAAEETVQLYVHDRVASLTQPGRLLKDFKAVLLQPGQSARVAFDLRPSQLTFINADLESVVEPGLFDVWVAPSAQGGPVATFRVTAPEGQTPAGDQR
ncbi:MAG: beta-glucosidase, partial [Brevundimonas sp.]|uniref:glycoside hydrolase family 3 C-terminal domain-containing protein n=2 Tax=Brevundimonas TaxID=41275 RepID=UPI000DBBF2E5